MNKKGFTLIEIIAVIIILGILAFIAIPQVMNAIENSEKNGAIVSANRYVLHQISIYEKHTPHSFSFLKK